MEVNRKERIHNDPRSVLLMLFCANVIAFTQKSRYIEIGWIAVIIVLYWLNGLWKNSVKLGIAYITVCLFQEIVLPVAPRMVVSCFAIFTNYTRRIFPCIMIGWMMIQIISLREFIAAMRKLHLPQSLIVPMAVTIRYFPAIKEETGHITDAIKLKGVKGFGKVEALTVPLMMSAVNTAEELSAAAVTRGIEDPAPKTTVLEMKWHVIDIFTIIISVGFTIGAFILK